MDLRIKQLHFSFFLGIIMAFKPDGVKVGGSILNQDTTIGNLNFFKCAEGFLESFPQSVYQLSLVIRTVPGKKLKVLSLFCKLQ